MNYFQSYSLIADETILAAWDSQVVNAADTPSLAQALATKSSGLFPRFAARYAELRALPRGARRALQRRLARSSDLAITAEWRRKLAGSIAGAALLLALGQGTAQAVDITVETNKPAIDSVDGLCSLIEAIVNANDDAATHADCPAGSGADRILLPANKTISLSSVNVDYSGPTALPAINSQIIIEGTGGSRIARKATAPAFRLLAVTETGNLTLRNVTLSGGRIPNDYGGAEFNHGNLTVENSTLSGNRANRGGAIFNDNDASATITNSTISGNHANYGGGGIMNDVFSSSTIQNSTISGNKAGYYGGGVMNYGEVTIENSTISGNTARFGGGGIYNDYFVRNLTAYIGTATVNNSTIASNRATSGFGGGIRNEGVLDLNRSLISGNHGNFGREVYHNVAFTGSVAADNFNIFGVNSNDGVDGFAPGATDIVPAVPLADIIGPLRNNGGPTKTRALPANSPAIDMIDNLDPGCVSPTTDQRGVGFPRPSVPGGNCDIGAFEKQ